ncbi:hypothetical protein OS493_013266 [Desmophyllum pertusum]|uniref:Cytochrome P450 n=1 Tax=Desmophyllum pertusum TaxID=174260 RepID=A0A9W9YQF2_9CNID|nr:hypothetical protein OS493_013266 [Desmophyllum pertusum]
MGVQNIVTVEDLKEFRYLECVLEAAVSLLAVVVFAAVHSLSNFTLLADLRKLPGPKPHILFVTFYSWTAKPTLCLSSSWKWLEDFYHEGLFCFGLVHLPFSGDLQAIIRRGNTEQHKTYKKVSRLRNSSQVAWNSHGDKWKTRRRLITPTFHFKILDNFIQVIEEQAAILVTHLEEKENRAVFDIRPYIARCTLEIICETAMGSSQMLKTKIALHTSRQMGELFEMRWRSPLMWSDTVYNCTSSGREMNSCLKIVHGFTDKVIDERIDERAAKKTPPEELGTESEREVHLNGRSAWLSSICCWKLMTMEKSHEKESEKKWIRLHLRATTPHPLASRGLCIFLGVTPRFNSECVRRWTLSLVTHLIYLGLL